MPKPRKIGDKWRMEVRRKGVYVSENFRTRAEAVRWGLEQEAAIDDGSAGRVPRKTLREAFERYAKDETPKKRGWRSEGIRIAKFIATLPFIDKFMTDVTSDDWAAWRDALAKGSATRKPLMPGTVIRDFNIIRALYSIALDEWGWVKSNPLKKVKNPPKPRGRTRLMSAAEIQALCAAFGYTEGKPTTKTQRVAVGLLFALETGMRAGEVFGLKPGDVVGRVAHLPLTKNGDPRDVPLSTRAVELIGLAAGEETVFGVSAKSADALFRKYRPAHLAGIHFHDARHTAATRLASSGRLTPFELCRMFGWTDLKMAMVYFNATAASIADKLD